MTEEINQERIEEVISLLRSARTRIDEGYEMVGAAILMLKNPDEPDLPEPSRSGHYS